LSLMMLLNHPFADEDLRDAEVADLRNIGKGAWPRILSNCHAKDLRLYHLTLESLDGIDRLTGTEKLTLEWATRVERLDPLFRMKGLSSLSVFDFPKLRDLSGIEALANLTELHLSGNRGSLSPPLRLASIKPVARLANLRSFSLVNARLEDDDITPLAELQELRHLQLANQFDRRQFAYLAKRLNGRLEEPLRSHVESSLQCEKCKGSKFMLTGRRMPLLCRACDSQRFQKLEREFEALVREA